MVHCVIWYYLYNFTKISTPPWLFFTFLNCTNGTKSRNVPYFLITNLVFYRLNCPELTLDHVLIIFSSCAAYGFRNQLNDILLAVRKNSINAIFSLHHYCESYHEEISLQSLTTFIKTGSSIPVEEHQNKCFCDSFIVKNKSHSMTIFSKPLRVCSALYYIEILIQQNFLISFFIL